MYDIMIPRIHVLFIDTSMHFREWHVYRACYYKGLKIIKKKKKILRKTRLSLMN